MMGKMKCYGRFSERLLCSRERYQSERNSVFQHSYLWKTLGLEACLFKLSQFISKQFESLSLIAAVYQQTIAKFM